MAKTPHREESRSPIRRIMVLLPGAEELDGGAVPAGEHETAVMAMDPADPTPVREALVAGGFTHVLIAGGPGRTLWPAGLRAIQEWPQTRNGCLYVADPYASSGSEKLPVSWPARWRHAVRRLVSPIERENTECGLFLTDAETARTLLDTPGMFGGDTPTDLPWRARLMGIPLVSRPCRIPEQKTVLPHARRWLRGAVTNRWHWFITLPWTGLRAGLYREIPWSDGRHPLYRLLFGMLCLVALIGLPLLSFDYGITWDEPQDSRYARAVYDWYATFGEDRRCLDVAGTMDHGDSGLKPELIRHLVNYGPVVSLAAEFLHTSLSPFGLYETRHLLNAFIALLGMLFTGLLARRAGTWKTGVLAFAFILLTPTLFGHGMNNHKDIPFMAFAVASLYYMVRLLEEAPSFRWRTAGMLILFLGMTLGVRAGGLLYFAYLPLFAGLHWLGNRDARKKGKAFAGIKSYLKPIALVLSGAYLVGILFWPAALQDPFGHPLAALRNFEKFGLTLIYEIFEGQRYAMTDFPWYYLPKSMLITVPLFVWAGLLLFLAGLWTFRRDTPRLTLFLLLFATLFPIGYVLFKQSPLYNSWRHLLFVYPTLAVLAAMGWDRVSTTIRPTWLRPVSALAMVVLIAPVLVWMVRNHPYQYLYYNELAGGLKGAYGVYETDYWCQSPRAAMEWLIREELPGSSGPVRVISNNDPETLAYFADQVSDRVQVLWARDHEWHREQWDYAIWTTRTLSPTQLRNGYFPPKGTIRVIEADGVPLAAIVRRERHDLAIGQKLLMQELPDSAMMHFMAYAGYDPLEEEAFRQWGLSLVATGRFTEGLPPLYRSIALCPENYFAWYYLGHAYRMMGREDSAMVAFSHAIRHKVSIHMAYEERGDIHFARGRFPEARTDYEQAFHHSDARDGVSYKLGETCIELRDWDQAMHWYQQAVRYNPGYAQAWLRIGHLYDHFGQPEEAANNYRKARELGLTL
jgi:Tfp pilus assembly protein PilF